MKIIKIILVVLVILIAVIVAITMFLPNHAHVERSMIMSAPVDIVFNQVKDFKNWENWSPWQKADDTVKPVYGEKTTGVGGSYSWTSEKSGDGAMKFVEMNENESIKTELDFGKKGIGHGTWKFEKIDDGTKVTWAFDEDLGGPSKWFGLLMDKILGKFFEDGLSNIKAISEEEAKKPKSKTNFEIKELDFPATYYIGVRRTMSIEDLQDFFKESYGKLLAAAKSKGIEITGSPAGIYFSWDEELKTTDMAAVFPVKEKVDLGNGFEFITMENAPSFQIDYYGSYDGTGEAHYAMDDYIKSKNKKQKSPVMEIYVTDPSSEPDTSKWLTRIVYFYE